MTAADSAERAQQHYDPREVQQKWLTRWAGMDLFRASDDPADSRPRTYLLDMFPYPSGDLHMGHAEAYAIGDAIARYYFHRGYNVLHPIGWDAFGLPAENAAIRNNSHPADWTYANIETQAASFRRYAVSFDWSRRLHTSDPEYYRWNQWLFLRFYERGLAYRKDGTGTVVFGEATLTVEVEVVFVSFDVSVTCHKEFAGDQSADPKFIELIPDEATWVEYCDAFAEEAA